MVFYRRIKNADTYIFNQRAVAEKWVLPASTLAAFIQPEESTADTSATAVDDDVQIYEWSLMQNNIHFHLNLYYEMLVKIRQ